MLASAGCFPNPDQRGCLGIERIVSRSDPLAIGTELQTVDDVWIGKRPQFLPGQCVPDLERPVVAPAGEALSVGAPGHGLQPAPCGPGWCEGRRGIDAS